MSRVVNCSHEWSWRHLLLRWRPILSGRQNNYLHRNTFGFVIFFIGRAILVVHAQTHLQHMNRRNNLFALSYPESHRDQVCQQLERYKNAFVLRSLYKLTPVSFEFWSRYKFHRFVFLNLETCSAEPLVSGESMVPDARLTASGSWDDNHGPHRARIHMIKEGDYRGGWIANYPWTNEQWIQVSQCVDTGTATVWITV